jgi:uncharacterized protein YndB with AHSA1/START domain
MPTATRTRRIAAPAEQLWDVVRDPHHLPRWWPRVTRVEGVYDGEFTKVMKTRKGKTVRADFSIVESDPERRRVRWEQHLEGTPFAGVLSSSQTEVRLEQIGEQALTDVTIELRQALSGQSRSAGAGWLSGRLGGRVVRRAAEKAIGEALDGLERISV